MSGVHCRAGSSKAEGGIDNPLIILTGAACSAPTFESGGFLYGFVIQILWFLPMLIAIPAAQKSTSNVSARASSVTFNEQRQKGI